MKGQCTMSRSVLRGLALSLLLSLPLAQAQTPAVPPSAATAGATATGAAGTGAAAAPAPAGTPTKPGARPIDAHRQQDIARHRALAAAHEASARCLESGETESTCHDRLRRACEGLAIGRYCGMKHAH
jgi:hypothetical protein